MFYSYYDSHRFLPLYVFYGDQMLTLHACRRSPIRWQKRCSASTELAGATCATIRAKLIMIGAVVARKLSIARLHLSSHYLCERSYGTCTPC